MSVENLDMQTLHPDVYRAVDDFLTRTTHDGYVKPFGGVERFEIESGFQNVVFVVPRNLGEEDIGIFDDEFDKGLARIGADKGLNLRLPYWAYEK